jgi:hypothetical protein
VSGPPGVALGVAVVVGIGALLYRAGMGRQLGLSSKSQL